MTSPREDTSGDQRSSDDHARFTALVREHQRGLFAHVRVVYPSADADSVVNDTFIAAWQRIDDVPTDRAGTWLRTTARFVVMNGRRSERRRRALTDRVAQLDPGADAPAPDHDAGLELQLVMRALASLSAADREVLLMTALDELSPEDMGEILGIRPNAAKTRVSRARARLRAAVAADETSPAKGGTR